MRWWLTFVSGILFILLYNQLMDFLLDDDHSDEEANQDIR